MSAASEPDIDSPADVAPSPERPRSALVRYGLTPWDAAAGAIALLLLVVFTPPLTFPHWTPHLALALGAMPIGLAVLVARCRERQPAAWWLAATVVWILVAAVVSDAPRSSLLGFAGRDVSALSLVACLMLWSLGSTVSERGRDVVLGVVIWSATVMALLGVLQVVADIESGPIGMRFERARAIYANPVYLGAVCAAAAVAAIAVHGRGGRGRLLGAVGVLGTGAALSGSRVAVGALLVLGIGLVVVHRSRRVVAAFGTAVGGLAAGTLIDRAMGDGRNAADRLSDRSSGGRLQIWRYAVDAWQERPLIGHGPGLFRPNVQSRFSLAFTRDAAGDELIQAWFDPHNALIHLLVIGGVGIVVLLLGWVVTWWRGAARGPALWGAGALVMTMGLQPMHLLTMALACLLFGVAGATRAPVASPPSRRVAAPLVGLGVVLGGWVLVADVLVSNGIARDDTGQVAWASNLYLGDPVVSDIVAQMYFLDDDEPSAIPWRERAAAAEPDRPYWWTQLGRAQLNLGDVAGAEESARRALALQPYNHRSIRLDFSLALADEDLERMGRNLDLLCELQLSDCGLDPAVVLGRLRPDAAGAVFPDEPAAP